MIVQWISDLGPWSWILLGAILLSAEIVLPGFFLLWIGVAALLTGTISFQLWDTGFWVWQFQVVVFLGLSILSAVLGKKLLDRGDAETDEPLLNRRDEQLIGRTATLEEGIFEGRGRIRIGDTLWRVSGPDLPAGTRVRVVAARGGDLTVEPV
jgi:membrane protein implicated in regulation of membrane protease activity